MSVDTRALEWINYHHLLYFRTVAREGSITRASTILGLAQPTISGQIRALEDTLGAKLFMRRGRNLVMTEFGRTVFGFADQIFALGEEMGDALRGAAPSKAPVLRVGTSRSLPESVLEAFLQPVLHGGYSHLSCRADSSEQLLAALASRSLDLVFADQPIGSAARAGLRTELLGLCGVSILGESRLAARLRPEFPQSLADVPFLLPIASSALRQNLDGWFADIGVRPRMLAELESEALLTRLAQSCSALIAVPAIVEADVCSRAGLEAVGTLDGIQQKFYAIGADASFSHPHTVSLIDGAKQLLAQQLAASC